MKKQTFLERKNMNLLKDLQPFFDRYSIDYDLSNKDLIHILVLSLIPLSKQKFPESKEKLLELLNDIVTDTVKNLHPYQDIPE